MTSDASPLISIIIPLYNAEETIVACLESCLNQTYSPLEIIAVDDGSSDNSWEIVQEFARNYPVFQTCKQDRSGVTEARNHGVRLSTGQYIFFMDADDELPPQSLEALMNRTRETGADITAGVVQHLTDKGEKIARMDYVPFSTLSGEEWLAAIRQTWQGHLWGLLLKKSLFLSSLFCPPSLKIGEDLLQVAQLAMRCKLVAMTEQTVYHYIKRETSVINSRQLPSRILNSDEVLFVEAMRHLQEDVSNQQIQAEYRLLALFAVINLPASNYRRKLIRHFRFLFLSYLLGDRNVISRLCHISRRLYVGFLLECFK